MLRRQAQTLWADVARHARTDAFARMRYATAQLVTARDATTRRRAAAVLERALKHPLPSTASVEAGIELSAYYTGQGRMADALRVLDECDQIIANWVSPGDTRPLWKAFERAVKLARDRAREPGKAEFERAEGLADNQRYDAAIALFEQVAQRYAESPYAPRSELAIGDCLIALGQPMQAEQRWNGFVANQPAGPWRGHALIRLINLHLEQFLDPARAAHYVELLNNSLTAALASREAEPSWQLVLGDVHYHIGLVTWMQGDAGRAMAAF